MNFRHWPVIVRKCAYGGGRVALVLEHEKTGERIAVATVNLPDEPLSPE